MLMRYREATSKAEQLIQKRLSQHEGSLLLAVLPFGFDVAFMFSRGLLSFV